MDNNKLYIGNLPWSVNNDSLREMFAEFGEITDCVVISDRDTGRSKGFGFVTFSSADSAQAAIDAMNEKEIDGRKLVVNAARPKEARTGGGGRY
ncbi:MAG: RNA recognition motif domain-containing protein [Weeksellaceae bacterium]